MVRIYTAEIVLALEYMHRKGIYHRDLKPENVVLDEAMHIRIVDFGTSNVVGMYFDKKKMKFVKETDVRREEILKVIDKKLVPDREILDTRYELVGTAEYVSPEVLNKRVDLIGPAVDLWALGCILYLLLQGSTPFKDKAELLIFENILNNQVEFIKEIDSHAKDLILKLLCKDPTKRIGFGNNASGYTDLKSHSFFWGIKWEDLMKPEPLVDLNYAPRNKSVSIGKDDNSLSPTHRKITGQSPDFAIMNTVNKVNDERFKNNSLCDIQCLKTTKICIEEDKDKVLLESMK